MLCRILLSVVLLSATFVPVAAQADGDGPPTRYRLTDAASFQEGCFGMCMCPILLLPMQGGFLLEPLGFDGLFWNFEVRNVNWKFRGEQGEIRRITGTGTYRFGGEFVVQHQLTLDLQIDNEEPLHFDSGLLVGGSSFPEIDIVASVGGMICYDQVTDLHARPVPYLSVGDGTVSWESAVGVTNYDVVWGDGQMLRANGGDFSEAVEWCLADDTTETGLFFDIDPQPGQVFWVLLRYDGPSAVGSYDSDTPEQMGSRDLGIGTSPMSCP